MARREELTDEQWAVLESLIPVIVRRADGRGRPEVHSDRAVLNGILWVLRTGACWADLPDRFPSGSTCFRRFSRWVKAGVMRQILEALARHLQEAGKIDLSECFIDGTFVVAKKGGPKVGKTKRGKGSKLMVIADAHGLPLAVHTASASPHEVTLVEATIDETVTMGRPRRLIGDRAYDSDPLDQRLAQHGIELIAPHKRNRKKAVTQDGRALRRYTRRWKIERTFAWLNKFKRVLTRWDRCVEHYTAFVHLALAMILLRRYL
ncbi:MULTISPECIES: IS5 family transposase [Noviherbaspirillum]|uniref:IS5 family transposase n=1 Tax=Noviherbaspirillum TaxID=1344552 RepID=UPI00124DDDB2|nr:MULTISPECIES: IS5 family transposase [Noviherbaspirillum]